MIDGIDELLNRWAIWRRLPDRERLGHASRTTVHVMMTTNAAKGRQNKYPRRPEMIGHGSDSVPRHTDPMRGINERNFAILSGNNPAEEFTDQAVAALKQQGHLAMFMVLDAYYCRNLGIKGAAYRLHCHISTIKARINHAHFYIDGWLTANVGEDYLTTLIPSWVLTGQPKSLKRG